MEYKVGDKVRIRSDLELHSAYQPTGCRKNLDEYIGIYTTYRMVQMSGEIVTIAKVLNYPHGGKYYYIKEDENHFNWADTMFCSISTDAPSFKTLL